MIKYQAITLKSKQDLRKVPKTFLELITDFHLGKTAVSFKTTISDVTLSKELLKVLAKVSTEDKKLLILTNNLTEDARKILEHLKIDYLTKSDFYWTDKSYNNIRQD